MPRKSTGGKKPKGGKKLPKPRLVKTSPPKAEKKPEPAKVILKAEEPRPIIVTPAPKSEPARVVPATEIVRPKDPPKYIPAAEMMGTNIHHPKPAPPKRVLPTEYPPKDNSLFWVLILVIGILLGATFFALTPGLSLFPE